MNKKKTKKQDVLKVLLEMRPTNVSWGKNASVVFLVEC